MNDNLNNQNQSQNENVNPNSSNVINASEVQAEIVGELRKEKIGKPGLVIEMFLLFAIVLIGLPFVRDMLEDETSVLYKLVYGNKTSVVSNTTSATTSYDDGSVYQVLNSSTSMMANNVILEKFTLKDNTINLTISSYTDVINLDELPIYLDIAPTSSNEKIGSVKLTGTYDNVATEIELESYGLSFNDDRTYKGKITLMTESDYPDVELDSDPLTGLGSLTCTKDGRTLVYNFQNRYLISIQDTNIVKNLETESNEEYQNLLSEARTKANALGASIASVEEDLEGFVYRANIPLDQENYEIPEDVIDYDYFEFETQAKIISYQLTAKGYECK